MAGINYNMGTINVGNASSRASTPAPVVSKPSTSSLGTTQFQSFSTPGGGSFSFPVGSAAYTNAVQQGIINTQNNTYTPWNQTYYQNNPQQAQADFGQYPEFQATSQFKDTNLTNQDLYNKFREEGLNNYNATSQFENGLSNAEQTNTINNYNSTVENLQQNLSKDLESLNNSEGENGTWASSARGVRRNYLENNYNNKFTSAYDNAQNSLYNSRMRQGYNYGNSAVNNSPLNSFYSKLGEQGGPSYTQKSGSTYNPFSSTWGGIKPTNFDEATKARVRDLYNTGMNYYNQNLKLY